MELILKSFGGFIDYIIERKFWCKIGFHSIGIDYSKRRKGIDYYCLKCGAEWKANKYGIYRRVKDE